LFLIQNLHLLSQPSFYALYRSFTQCQFIEDEGDIIFYKNREGKAVRAIHPNVVEEMNLNLKGKETQDTVVMKLEFGDDVAVVSDKAEET
jgi:hypothetical protein